MDHAWIVWTPLSDANAGSRARVDCPVPYSKDPSCIFRSMYLPSSCPEFENSIRMDMWIAGDIVGKELSHSLVIPTEDIEQIIINAFIRLELSSFGIVREVFDELLWGTK